MNDYQQTIEDQRVAHEVSSLAQEIVNKALKQLSNAEDDDESQQILLQRMKQEHHRSDLLMATLISNISHNLVEMIMEDKDMQKAIRKNGAEVMKMKIFDKTMKVGFLTSIEFDKAKEAINS